MTLYKDKYRIESTRLKDWDYSRSGYYFVTICTQDKKCLFGDVIDEKVRLSAIGEIVADEWQKTAQIRKNVSLDIWIIMPNHLHGIVIINNNNEPHGNTQKGESYDNKFGPQANNLSSIIRGFKSATTKRIYRARYDFSWQSRFYDHIIRNEKSLMKIREYIINNPLKWELDKNNPANLFM
jgi:REP element-mobilizing transposase RayT